MYSMSRNRILWGVGILVGFVVLSSAAIFGYSKIHQPIFSSEITSKLTSSLYVAQGDNVTIERASIKYDKDLKQLSYVSKMQDISIIVSEQPSPEVFGDVPQYFDKWITSAGAITNFDTPNGKVYLASNPNYGVNTVAIMNSKGTLLFAKPSKNLSQDQWKQFFRTLKLQT